MGPEVINPSEAIYSTSSESLDGSLFSCAMPTVGIAIGDGFTETVEGPNPLVDSISTWSEDKFIPLRHVSDTEADRKDDVDYQLLSELGAGGTAVVYQAHQRAVDRQVAVKTLRSELSAIPSARARFLAEARVIGTLDHPNVIALHEVYTDSDGLLSYSMQRIDGTSWDKQIADRTTSQNIETLLRISDAICCAHSHGIIHRDIKPKNVMLGKFGEVLLADWGLAVREGDDQATSSSTRSMGGTPAYMAPEMASSTAGAITFQTDIYLLGAILYEILTGHPPHEGESLMHCIRAAANNEIVPTKNDSELMEIAKRAMAGNPADRYADVEEFIAALRDYRQHEQAATLIRRAFKLTKKADGNDAENPLEESELYRNFGVADAMLVEASELWPENEKIGPIRKRFQLRHAAIAAGHGNFDLAASLYEATGESESDEAVMVQFHRLRRDASQMEASRYSVLFSLSPDPGLLIDMTTTTVFDVNLAYGKMFGCMSEQQVGQRIDELSVWETPEIPRAILKLARVEGEVFEYFTQFRHAKGQTIEVQINSQLICLRGDPMLLSTIRPVR